MLALLCLTTACSKAENKPTPEPSSNPVISVVDLPVTQAPIAQPEFETTWALTSTDGYGILESTFSNIKIIMNSPGTEIFRRTDLSRRPAADSRRHLPPQF